MKLSKFSKIAFRVMPLVAFGLVFGTFNASAELGSGGQIIQNVTNDLSGLGDTLMRLVRVIAVLAGFASAIMVVVNLLKQERDSVTKAIFWAIGMVAAFAITSALSSALRSAGTGGSAGADAFGIESPFPAVPASESSTCHLA